MSRWEESVRSMKRRKPGDENEKYWDKKDSLSYGDKRATRMFQSWRKILNHSYTWHISFFLKSRSNKRNKWGDFPSEKQQEKNPYNASLCNFFFHPATPAKSQDIVLYLSRTWTREGEPLNVLWNFLTTLHLPARGRLCWIWFAKKLLVSRVLFSFKCCCCCCCCCCCGNPCFHSAPPEWNNSNER